MNKSRETAVDPEYKIYKRFRKFADRLTREYTTLYMLYGEALNIVNEMIKCRVFPNEGSEYDAGK